MTQDNLSEILDELLGLLLLEGSYDIEETDEYFTVSIQTPDAGRLIGYRGESLDALQLIVNQIASVKYRDSEGYKRVILDVEGWRKSREEALTKQAAEWIKQAVETGKPVELEPMSPWQRRVVHMVVQESGQAASESIGEGKDRHIVITPGQSKKTEAVEE